VSDEYHGHLKIIDVFQLNLGQNAKRSV